MIQDDRQAGWDEADSREFIDLGRFFVPAGLAVFGGVREG